MRSNQRNNSPPQRRQTRRYIPITRIPSQHRRIPIIARQSRNHSPVLEIQPPPRRRLPRARAPVLGIARPPRRRGTKRPVDLDHGVLLASDLRVSGFSLRSRVCAGGQEAETGGAACEEGAEAEAEIAAAVFDKGAQLGLVGLEFFVGLVEIWSGGVSGLAGLVVCLET